MKPWIKHLLIRIAIIIIVSLYLVYETLTLGSPDNALGLGYLFMYIYGILFILYIIDTLIILLFLKSKQKFLANLSLIVIAPALAFLIEFIALFIAGEITF